MTTTRAAQEIEVAIAEIMSLYAQRGDDDYLGEPVSQLQHAAQAADLASAQGYGLDVICAAFLHDIGHLCSTANAPRMDAFGVAHHEQIGADYLRARGVSDTVSRLVAGHVAAKRYLTQRNPKYFAQLSAASKRTLEFQGGPMSAADAEAFESDSLAPLILALRHFDEGAKDAALPAPALARYAGFLRSHLTQHAAHSAVLTDTQLAFWRAHGWLKIEGYLDPVQMTLLNAWTMDLQQRPETPGKWMKYFEADATQAASRLLCRVENFVQYHPGFADLIDGEAMRALVGALFGEPAALFKEKINFKLPGGAGFLPHQDAPAFTTFTQSLHITVMVSIDATTASNGCLEIAPHPGDRKQLPTAPDLTIDATAATVLPWTPILTTPGDLLVFDSFLPHRSRANLTSAPRRVLYLTYNKAAEGNVRDAYFAKKRATFPPDVERARGRNYGDAGVFNVGNPIR